MFELLPLDFQNMIAPSLVLDEDVYWASYDDPAVMAGREELVSMSLKSDGSYQESRTSL